MYVRTQTIMAWQDIILENQISLCLKIGEPLRLEIILSSLVKKMLFGFPF
jgi:hypothetical protein